MGTYVWLVCGWLNDLRMDTNNTNFKEIGLRAQNMLTILGSIINIVGGPIWPLSEHKNWNKWLQARFRFAKHLVLIACFISYRKWVRREKLSELSTCMLTGAHSSHSDILETINTAFMSRKVICQLSTLHPSPLSFSSSRSSRLHALSSTWSL